MTKYWNIYIMTLVFFIMGCGGPNQKGNLASELEEIALDEYGIPLGAVKADSFYIHEAESAELEVSNKIDVPAFLKLFTEIEMGDLHVFSDKNGNYEEFTGTKIEAKYTYLFRNTDIANYFDSDDKDFEIYATQKITLNDTIVALIIRHYGMYSPNRVSLFFLNVGKQDITSTYELAIYYGDEGQTTNTESWIRKLSGELLIFSWTINGTIQSGEILSEDSRLISTNGIIYDNTTMIPWINPELEPVMRNNSD